MPRVSAPSLRPPSQSSRTPPWHGALLSMVAVAVACAGRPASSPPASSPSETPAAAPAEPPTPVEAEPKGPPCASDADCTAQARALRDAGDTAGARAMWESGCEAGGPDSCDQLALSWSSEDSAKAMKLWESTCDAGSVNACFNAAEHIRESDAEAAVSLYTRACVAAGLQDGGAVTLGLVCGRGSGTAYAAQAFDAARTMAEVICDDAVTSGCGMLGVLYAKGQGVDPDLQRSGVYLQRGCKGGDDEACKNLEVLERSTESTKESDALANALPVEGANVSMGSVRVDGLSATDLQCRRDGGGGLFGGAMGAISGVAKRKAKLNKCARAPEDVRVRWKTGGGKIKTVDVKASTPKVEACVKKAVRGASAAFGGTCAATFSIGN